jgi:hypothetical protein
MLAMPGDDERPEQRPAGDPDDAVRDDSREQRHEGDRHRHPVEDEPRIVRREVVPGGAAGDERHRDAECEVVRCEIRRREPP